MAANRVLMLLTFMALAACVLSLRCYKMLDTNAPGQANIKKTAINCTASSDTCTALYVKTKVQGKTYKVSREDCGMKVTCGKLCAAVKKQVASVGGKIDSCKENCCAKDLCNASTKVSAGSGLLLSMALALSVFVMKN